MSKSDEVLREHLYVANMGTGTSEPQPAIMGTHKAKAQLCADMLEIVGELEPESGETEQAQWYVIGRNQVKEEVRQAILAYYGQPERNTP